MKKFVFALLLSIPIIRFSFAQTEIIANDYYDIEFFDSNKSKDVPDEFDASTFYQLEDLHLKRSELRELKKILKLCGLRMKNNRIIFPDETQNKN